MSKFGVCVAIAVPLLVLAYCHFPERSCFTRWEDSAGEEIAEPFSSCSHKFESRTVGRYELAAIARVVYAVEEAENRQAAGFPCMTGGACLPIWSRPKVWRHKHFTKLDGPVDLDRMRPFLDGQILSDGAAVFVRLRRVASQTPPIEPARLRPLLSGYVTDGRWVLYEHYVLDGADPATLRSDIPTTISRTGGGPLPEITIVRDRHAVFHEHERIDGADASTFIVVNYDVDDLPPGTGLTGGGWFGVDKRGAWSLSLGNYVVNLDKRQHRALRADVERLLAARPRLDGS